MDGVLGSFKNMLKRWKLNLKIKKKQQEQSKKDKYCFTSFLYSLIAIIICPIGLTFNSKKNQKSKDNIFSSDKSSENLTPSPINSPPNEYFASNSTVNYSNINKNPKIWQNSNPMKVKKSNITSSKNIVIEKLDQDFKTNKVEDKKTNKSKPAPLQNCEIKKQNAPTLVTTSKTLMSQLPLKHQKHLTSQVNIEQIEKEMQEIETEILAQFKKIKTSFNYNDLYYLESRLNELKEKNKNIQTKLKNISKHYLQYIKSTELTELINQQQKCIEIKKDELYYGKNKQHKKNQNNDNQPHKQEAKQKIKDVNETLEAKMLVIQNIVDQTNLFEEYLKNCANSNKQTIKNNYLNIVSNNLFNFTFTFLPIVTFTNPLLGYLVSAYMINNYIKTMSKIVNPTSNIKYDFIISEYKNNKEILNDFQRLCNNSLNELFFLKNEIKHLNDEKLLKEIEEIEKNIIKHKEQIEQSNIMIDRAYIKMKNKINY